MNLPEAFIKRMETLLGDEFPAFLACYEEPCQRGIRLNPLKCGEDRLRESFPFPLSRAPFSPLSFYFPPEGGKVGALALHHAGAFYSQEPSAACAVTALDPQPGERILDLCAAPGGKSSQSSPPLLFYRRESRSEPARQFWPPPSSGCSWNDAQFPYGLFHSTVFYVHNF